MKTKEKNDTAADTLAGLAVIGLLGLAVINVASGNYVVPLVCCISAAIIGWIVCSE
jgi:hypothetical protein